MASLKERLQEILIRDQIITPAQLEAAIEEQKKFGGELSKILVKPGDVVNAGNNPHQLILVFNHRRQHNRRIKRRAIAAKSRNIRVLRLPPGGGAQQTVGFTGLSNPYAVAIDGSACWLIMATTDTPRSPWTSPLSQARYCAHKG